MRMNNEEKRKAQLTASRRFMSASPAPAAASETPRVIAARQI